jgi:hypothetical protein
MKTLYKISHTLLMLGWFPFMFLCIWGMRLDTTPRLMVASIGFGICICSALAFTQLLSNKGFWLTNKILDSEIEKTRIAKANYEKAEKCLINKVLEIEGMSKGNTEWLFLAYKSEEDYPHTPYFYKIFYDHAKMKEFSADHSSQEKKYYPTYVSNYFKINNSIK